jgi:hypothetical protein
MHHPQLGKLQAEGKLLSGNLTLNDRNITMRIDPDDAPVDQTLSLAASVASTLSIHDELYKDIIVRDLLEVYNSGWNEYDEVQDDGSIKSVVNPQLNQLEFKNRMSLVSINVSSDCCVELWYENDDLFWGHSILVQSLEGAKLTSFKAQLFG